MYITFLIDVIIELLGPSLVRKTHFVNIFILLQQKKRILALSSATTVYYLST